MDWTARYCYYRLEPNLVLGGDDVPVRRRLEDLQGVVEGNVDDRIPLLVF